MVPGDKRYRLFYVIWGFLECLGFGGLIYGWGSFVFVLKDEGLYLDLCSDSETNDSSTSQLQSSPDNEAGSQPLAAVYNNTEKEKVCNDRDSKLALAFTIAMCMFCVGCFILGIINSKYGIRLTRLVAAAIFISGALMLAFMSQDVPSLIFPGLSLLGAGGIAYLMTNMQLSVLFPKGGSIVVGLMCGGFDASSGIQLLIKIGYENQISRQTSYIILACAHLLTLVSTFFFLPKDFFRKPPTTKSEEVADDKETGVKLKGKADELEDEPIEKKDSLINCMLSPIYLLHILWLSILQLRFYFFLASLNGTLKSLLDSNDEVSHYTNIFMYILMCGLITSPFAGFVCDLFKRFFDKSQSSMRKTLFPLIIPLALTTTLCIVMSGLILINDASTMFAVFVFLLFFRSFMYTLAAGYIGAVFPGEYFGIMYGILTLTAGVISMFQYALFTWSEAAGFQQVNVFLMTIIGLTYVHPLYLWITCRRAETRGSFSLVKQ